MAPIVLFVCVHNAGRSQMAAALLEKAGGRRVRVRSAGTQPSEAIHPVVIEAMAEVGIDLSQIRPRALDPSEAESADVVVTMGCGDDCPVYPGTRYEDWQIEDPSDKSIKEVREIRGEIERRVRVLLAELTAEKEASTGRGLAN